MARAAVPHDGRSVRVGAGDGGGAALAQLAVDGGGGAAAVEQQRRVRARAEVGGVHVDVDGRGHVRPGLAREGCGWEGRQRGCGWVEQEVVVGGGAEQARGAY